MTSPKGTDGGASVPPKDMAPTPAATGIGAEGRSADDDAGQNAPCRDESKAEKRGSYTCDDTDRPMWDAHTILEAEYEYYSDEGIYCFTVCRGSHPDGVKRFTIRRRNMIKWSDRLELEDRAEWFSGMGGLPHMLYRLPGLVAADPARVVFVVEGEKDADTLVGLGLTATTNSSGAGKWLNEYSKHLSGRDVVILPDNDDVGRNHAAKVARSVKAIARSVKIIELPGLPEKGDVSDWIEAGRTKDELLDLVDVAQTIADPDEWHLVRQSFIMGVGGKIPLASPDNAYLALGKLNVRVSYDEFVCEYRVEGLHDFGPMLDDRALTRLRLDIEKRFRVAYPKERWFDIISDHALNNKFHPVRDYLDSLHWDGKSRLDSWLIDYGGAVQSEFVSVVGALVLVAAVRRIRHPGTKFDQMLVLEGFQGGGKSSALAILAVNEDWFTDDVPWDSDTKTLIERLKGKFIVEAAELKGMRQAEIEKIKATLSRRSDIARLSYDRMTTVLHRQCVIFGTTNSEDYLRDMTGNRRFWPVKIGRFDLEKLMRDRDQIWAEANERERAGASIELPQRLWAVAAEHQDRRLASDPFEQTLFGPLLEVEGWIRTEHIWQVLGLLDKSKRTQPFNTRLGAIMKRYGWLNKQMRVSGHRCYCYVKGDDTIEVPLSTLFPADSDIL